MKREPAKLFTNCPWEVESKSIDIGNYRAPGEVETGSVNLTPQSTQIGFNSSTTEQPIFKAFIPWFMYKPPYGFPRENNPLQLRQFAKNPYIFAVKKTIADQVSGTNYDIKLREEYIEEGATEDKEAKKQIINFFDNPNGNDESFEFLLRSWVNDVIDIGNFVGVKVFDKGGRFCQLYARDAGTFLKNPDIYGYMGDRADFVPPATQYLLTDGMDQARDQLSKIKSPEDLAKVNQSVRNTAYDAEYKESAAYFQYGWTAGARPVPFGKREILWGGLTPRTNSIYEQAPIEILYNQILTLVYGSEYNLDFYLNNNLPNGLLTIKGATQDQASLYRQQMENTFMNQDDYGNFKKKHFKIPITGYEAIFTQMQMSSKEMEVIEQQKWFAKLVWSVFGVTAEEMGFTEDSNKAVSENQASTSKRKSIKPFLKMFEYAINTQLMPEFGHPEFEFKFDDYDLAEDKAKHDLWQMQINMGVRTPRQIAVEELGISDIEYDAAEKDKNDKEVEKENAMNGQNDFWTKSEKKSMYEFEKEISLNELEADLKQALTELELRIMEDLEMKFQARGLHNIKGYIDVKAEFQETLEQYKGFFTDKGYEKKIAELINKEFQKGVDEIEKQINKNVVVNTSKVQDLSNYVYKNIKGMNEEMINKLQQQITLGILNRENLEQVKTRVKGVMNMSTERAIMIARTESIRALNQGNLQAAKESGINFKKKWDARLDSRTSEGCRHLDGQVVGLNEKFKWNGEEFDAPPAHPNCRSRVLLIEED
jgi:SPP1 gp7 family putative phage head morphogenesis protein